MMRRLALMLFTVAVFLARPAWPQTQQPVNVSADVPTSQVSAHTPSLNSDGSGRPLGHPAAAGAPVLFVPVEPGTYARSSGTDNYGRPLQPRPLQ